jgi:hypothetical protein
MEEHEKSKVVRIQCNIIKGTILGLRHYKEKRRTSPDIAFAKRAIKCSKNKDWNCGNKVEQTASSIMRLLEEKKRNGVRITVFLLVFFLLLPDRIQRNLHT